jgi:hypothetical protein
MTGKSAFPIPLAALVLLAAACDSPSGAGGGGRVEVRMGVDAAQGGAAPVNAATAAAGALVVEGTNGVLTVDGVKMVVAEFELDGDDDVAMCRGGQGTDDRGGDDDCEDFDAGPFLVDLPLGGGEVAVTTGDIPNGTYRRVEFEVEDLDDHDDDVSSAAEIAALRQQILAQFPDWPRDASMLVTGTFQPRANGTLGAARPFRTFVEARVRVRVRLQPPLVVNDASASRTVSVTLDPAAFFKTGGQVRDLSQAGGRIRVEAENGFHGSGHGSDD